MPFALPLVTIAIKPLIIAGLGVVTAAVLGWYLSTPKGAVTWKKIVAWADTQIKAPVEWALKGIKEGLKNVAEAWERFRKALSGYVDWVYDYIWKMHDWIMWKITGVVIPKIQILESWRYSVVKWLHSYIEVKVLNLEKWKAGVVKWLHSYIEPKVLLLEKWRYGVTNWLHGYIERLLINTMTGLQELKEAVSKAFEDVWKAINSLRQGAVELGLNLVRGITSDVLPNIEELIKNLVYSLSKAIGITGILSALGTWINSLLDNIAKELKDDIDFIDNLDLDWLLIAYLEYTKPVLIDEIEEVANIIFNCAKAVAKK